MTTPPIGIPFSICSHENETAANEAYLAYVAKLVNNLAGNDVFKPLSGIARKLILLEGGRSLFPIEIQSDIYHEYYLLGIIPTAAIRVIGVREEILSKPTARRQAKFSPDTDYLEFQRESEKFFFPFQNTPNKHLVRSTLDALLLSYLQEGYELFSCWQRPTTKVYKQSFNITLRKFNDSNSVNIGITLNYEDIKLFTDVTELDTRFLAPVGYA